MIAGVREDGAHWRVGFYQRRSALRAPESDGWFARNKIRVLEADVDPVRRWITDSGCEIGTPRRAYIDIETDSRVPFSRGAEARILSWSLVDEDLRKVGRVLLEDTDVAERELIRELFRVLQDYDLAIAWNGDRFDFVRIGARVGILGIGVELRRWLWMDHMRVFNKLNVSAAESGDEKQFAGLGAVAASVLGPEQGRKLLELGRLGGPTTWGIWEAGVANVSPELREQLRAAAKVGDEVAYYELLPDDWKNLRDYNVDDSEKMRGIEARTGYIDLLETRCRSTFTLPDSRGLKSTLFVEGFMMRLAASRTPPIRFASRVWNDNAEEENTEQREQFKGAFVLEPKRLGIIKHVHVCDFARLYPSIIQTFNMSAETWRPDIQIVPGWWEHRPPYLQHLPKPPEEPIPEGHCAAALTNQVFANEPVGILSECVTELLRLRKTWDDLKKHQPPGTPAWKEADRRSTAYKNTVNAFFGVVGSVFSRLYVREVAESISQTGVWLIQETIAAIEARGWTVIYADTDSAFVIGCSEEDFAEFVAWCDRELYPRLIRERGCSRSTISLAYEKAFKVLVLFGKKRYAATFEHFKGERASADSRPEIKGLEFKRGDSAQLGRRMQEEIVKRMLAGVEDVAVYEEIVTRYRARVLEQPLARDEVLLSKRLSQRLQDYARTLKKDGKTFARQSQHVEVARLLEERGRDVGAGVRIEYLVLDNTTDPVTLAPAEDWTPALEVDRHYLWESMVYPPSSRILEIVFRMADWKRWERSRPRATALAGVGDLFAASDLRKVRDVVATVPAVKKASPKAKARGWDRSGGQGDLF